MNCSSVASIQTERERERGAFELKKSTRFQQVRSNGSKAWTIIWSTVSDLPYNCLVMDMQHGDSLADSAPAPSRRLFRSLHTVQVTVRH